MDPVMDNRPQGNTPNLNAGDGIHHSDKPSASESSRGLSDSTRPVRFRLHTEDPCRLTTYDGFEHKEDRDRGLHWEYYFCWVCRLYYDNAFGFAWPERESHCPICHSSGEAIHGKALSNLAAWIKKNGIPKSAPHEVGAG